MGDAVPFLDMTLDELRLALAPLVAANAVFDGWSDKALSDAAVAVGIPADRARLAYPGGAIDMIDVWFLAIDRALEQRLKPETLGAMKIRERIRTLVLTRLDIARPQREAVRRALAKLTLPMHLSHAARLGWRGADIMWRMAGDTTTDFNHYSKRAILATVYAATLLIWLDDESEDSHDTKAFLDKRIDGIMRFEAAKARLKPDGNRHFSPTRLLGRLRYPDA